MKKQTKKLKNDHSYTNILRYKPNYDVGLTNEQVSSRVAEGLVNTSIDKTFKSVKQILFENIFSYFNFIFLVLGILLCLVQSYNNLTFLPVVIINTVIGIIQEIRSKKVLENLKVINATKARTIRAGQEQLINIEELVLDDVVIFKAGDQVIADAIVLEGSVQVNESLLTGESDEISKNVDSDLLSGSYIVSGQCYARLDKVGSESYISKLTLKAKAMKNEEQSKMVQSLDKLVKWVGIIIIPIGVVLFSQSYFFNGDTFKESIISMEAALIGMIPEGLYLLTTLALALSATQLAKQKVLLHNMKSIETLARVNVLCVDKTGTITENSMKVSTFISIQTKEELDIHTAEFKLLSEFCAAQTNDNITMEALKKYFNAKPEKEILDHNGFSSVRKFSSVTFEEGTFLLGAPEMVLRNQFENYRTTIQEFVEEGYRVLVFGKYLGTLTGKELEHPVDPLCYVLLKNPIRKEARQTFTYFQKQSVNIKVISGDNPLTVSKVALEAGIAGSENYIDAQSLTDRDLMKTALRENTVFGRVTPDQKKLLVELLKEDGNTVAMTGDGVNDILAMKEADCSIAMASGNEAAMQAAQVVLLESDFSKMPEVVDQGRKVVNNIQRSASLFLVKNIFSLLLSVFAVIFSISYPLQPSQITLISLFTIGIPSFFLALEPNKSMIKGDFLTNILIKAAPGGITDMLVVAVLVICGIILDLDKTDISTAATMLLVVVGFLVLYKISSPLNQYRKKIFLYSAIGILITGFFFNDVFSLSRISDISVFLLIILFFSSESIFRLLTHLAEKIGLKSLNK